MSSRYLVALAGKNLEYFTSCMRQKGRFSYYHVKVPSHTLLRFQNRNMLKSFGGMPKVYIVPATIANDFKKMYPDIRVQYIESKILDTKKHGISRKTSASATKAKA